MKPHALTLVMVLAFGCDGSSRNPGPEGQGPVSGGYSSDPNPTGGGSRGGTAPQDICGEVARVLCSKAVECQTPTSHGPVSYEECLAAFLEDCDSSAFCGQDETFHPELFGPCLDGFSLRSCTDLPTGHRGFCEGVCEKPPRT